MATLSPERPIRGSTQDVGEDSTEVLIMRQFSVQDYHRMIKAGIFGKGEKVELLKGFIVQKMPHDPIHLASIAHARKVLAGLLPPGFHVRVQSSITLSSSEPEPDLAVVVGDELDYINRHPNPADVLLVIEVSNTSLSTDRGLMSEVYAGDGIPNYAILDLIHSRLELRADPSGDANDPVYRTTKVLEAGQSHLVTCGAISIAIDVDALIPPLLRRSAR